MKIFHSPAEIPADFGPSAVTIGNFDGVHNGHREIMRRLVERARAENLTPVVLTFDPHPARVLAPERAPKLIATVAQRTRLMQAEGIEAVLLLPFSRELAKLSPEQFTTQILRNTLHARVVMVGDDFRFGHKQSGDVNTLRQAGFEVLPVEPILGSGRRVSSSAIRELVRQGRVSRACRLLGAPFTLEGPVVSGHGIGHKQTVPTLNLAPENELLPANGVYVTLTGGLPSITNVGMRPTFNGGALTVETFLLEAPSAETPARIEVEFLAWVRGERKFDSPELLKAQILRDAGCARRFHERRSRIIGSYLNRRNQ